MQRKRWLSDAIMLGRRSFAFVPIPYVLVCIVCRLGVFRMGRDFGVQHPWTYFLSLRLSHFLLLLYKLGYSTIAYRDRCRVARSHVFIHYQVNHF